MKLIPTKGRLVVKQVEQEEATTQAGIILASRDEVESEEILKVRVIAGDNDYREGLVVYVSKYSALPIKDNVTGETVFIVPISDVMAVETEE